MRVLRDTWQRIVVAAILGLIFSFTTWILPGGWQSVWNGIRAFFAWITGDASHPRWLLGILWSIALAVVLAIARVNVVKIRKPPKRFEPREKLLYGILWRYRWTKYGIPEIHSFCPKCDVQIHPVLIGSYFTPDTVYECDNPECQRTRREFAGKSQAQVEDLVIRKVQQELRAKIRDAEKRNAEQGAAGDAV